VDARDSPAGDEPLLDVPSKIVKLSSMDRRGQFECSVTKQLCHTSYGLNECDYVFDCRALLTLSIAIIEDLITQCPA
jgi:hypothetical protein